MREKSSPLGYYTIGIAALFLLGFLLLIVFGAGVYKDTVEKQDGNNQTRALRSYLVTCSQAASPEDVEVKDEGEGPEGQVLVIRDGGSGYGLHIFLHEGQLKEYYGRLDTVLDPDEAKPIAETSGFDVEKLTEEAYAVTTDAGRAILHIGNNRQTDDPEGGDAQ